MDSLKLNNILLIILLCIILYKMYNKHENADSVSSWTLSNEAIQNIASVYADTKGTVNFNNFNAANFKGIIVAWSGLIANIPTGWGLCDGTNGTPDLRGRFLRMLSKPGNSANSGYYNEAVLLPGVDPVAAASQGSGNGSKFPGLQTSSQIVGNLQIGSMGGTDSYQLQVVEMPEHSHKAQWGEQGGPGNPLGYSTVNPTGYPIDIPSSGGKTGGDSGHPSTPPYYVVAYIIKL